MKNPLTVPLPPHLVTLAAVLADESGLSVEMFRLILQNVYRNGFADGRFDGIETACDVAAEEIGKRAIGGVS